ncbi:MAG: aminopeptidase P family protein [Saprospiraceae bacterium]
MFPTKTYVKRRQQLQQKVKSGLILLLGNEESSMNYTDNHYHFRQDSNFLYFLGLDQAGLAGIIDVDNNQTILFGNELTIDDIVWTGPQPALTDLAAQVGVTKVKPKNAIAKYLKKARKQGQAVHFLPPYRPENKIKLSEWLGIKINGLCSLVSVPLVKAVISLAEIKSSEEIAEMEKAVNISRAMHIAAMEYAKPGMTEAEVTGKVHGIAVSGGGNLSYPIILTVNGQTLHNHYHGNVLKKGQLVLGDFGAETAMHYAGDITRTFPVSKKFTAQQREIYQIVLDANMQCIKASKAGVLYRDVHLLAAKIKVEGLKALGIMKGDTEAAVKAGAHGLFFPHGLGHMIGLDVHDMEDLGEDLVGYNETVQRSNQFGLRSLRLGKALETGNVITVEPGLYFIPELINRWKSEQKFTEFINYKALKTYRDFGGIRIEDNVLITKKKQRVLGKHIPKTIKEVEAIRAKGK